MYVACAIARDICPRVAEKTQHRRHRWGAHRDEHTCTATERGLAGVSTPSPTLTRAAPPRRQEGAGAAGQRGATTGPTEDGGWSAGADAPGTGGGHGLRALRNLHAMDGRAATATTLLHAIRHADTGPRVAARGRRPAGNRDTCSPQNSEPGCVILRTDDCRPHRGRGITITVTSPSQPQPPRPCITSAHAANPRGTKFKPGRSSSQDETTSDSQSVSQSASRTRAAGGAKGARTQQFRPLRPVLGVENGAAGVVLQRGRSYGGTVRCTVASAPPTAEGRTHADSR